MAQGTSAATASVDAARAAQVTALQNALAETALRGKITTALTQVGTMQIDQSGRLDTAYRESQGEFRDAAREAGDLAVSEAAVRARAYRAEKTATRRRIASATRTSIVNRLREAGATQPEE